MHQDSASQGIADVIDDNQLQVMLRWNSVLGDIYHSMAGLLHLSAEGC